MNACWGRRRMNKVVMPCKERAAACWIAQKQRNSRIGFRKCLASVLRWIHCRKRTITLLHTRQLPYRQSATNKTIGLLLQTRASNRHRAARQITTKQQKTVGMFRSARKSRHDGAFGGKRHAVASGDVESSKTIQVSGRPIFVDAMDISVVAVRL